VCKAGETSNFLFGTITEEYNYAWFEDFDLLNYSDHLNNLRSLMDKKETTVSRKDVDDKTVVVNCKFVFSSNNVISNSHQIFSKRVEVITVDHRLFDCGECDAPFIPHKQFGLFDVDGEQLLIDLVVAANDFTLDLFDENATHADFEDTFRVMTGMNEDKNGTFWTTFLVRLHFFVNFSLIFMENF